MPTAVRCSATIADVLVVGAAGQDSPLRCEVRVVGDEERAIVNALNALRPRYTYVFTTGGIGPTHGDITADCVAKSFGVPIDTDPRALAILHEWVKTTGAEMNEARLRMTHIPKGASSTRCHRAPGFRKCNRDGAGQTRGREHAGAKCGEHNQIAPEPRPLTANRGATSAPLTVRTGHLNSSYLLRPRFQRLTEL